MSDIDYTQTAEELQNELADEDVDVAVDTLEDGIREGVETYSLDLSEAVRTVANKYTPDDGATVTAAQLGDSENEEVAIEEIPDLHDNADNESAWVDATVEILSTWDIDADSVAQKAQIADQSGKAQLTVWASADAPRLSEGDIVHLGNVPTDEYQGSYSLKVTSDSTVEFQEDDIDAVDNLERMDGRIVKASEGLVRRCPDEDCSRVIDSGHCPDHGEVDGEEDLRLKLTIDDGEEAEDVVLQRPEVESVLGITMQDALDILDDTLDREQTSEELREGIVGKRASVAGPHIYGSIQAEEIVTMDDPLDGVDVNEMLVEAREARAEVLSH